jgi:hypothetical protein
MKRRDLIRKIENLGAVLIRHGIGGISARATTPREMGA